MDNADFPAGNDINVPSDNDFRVGDPVVFTVEGSAKLDTALTAGTTYYVTKRTATAIQVANAAGGAAITLNGDGGLGAAGGGVVSTIVTGTLPTSSGGSYSGGPYTGLATTGGSGTGLTVDVTVTTSEVSAIALNAGGTGYLTGETITIDGALLGGASGTNDVTFTTGTTSAITSGGDTAGDKNHIGVSFAKYEAVCQAREFSISLDRESLDVTTLPCGVGSGGGKYANFRATQAGYASGEGTVSVYFTSDQKTMANRLLGSTVLKSQLGAWVKLYINTIDDGTGKPDDVGSLYIEAPVSITGMSFSVNPDDATTAELSFTINGQPKHLFDMDL